MGKARGRIALTFRLRLLFIFSGLLVIVSDIVFGFSGIKFLRKFFFEVIVIAIAVVIIFVNLHTIVGSFIHCLFVVFTHGCSPPKV